MRELITGVFKHTLSNGMRVLLCPSSRVDLACVLTWVKSGYFHESDDVSGISHLIEHMLFKGTKKRGVGEIAMQTKALGGYLNASTTYDHTSYHTIVPAKFVHEALDIQSDVLLNPLFDAKELEREKEVVFQEMKKKLDQPHAFAREKLFELAFEKHRMRRWRIGTEESLLTLSKDRVLDYYNHHYTPENIIVVVSGKFNADDVIKTIERLYEPMTRVEGQVSQGPSEPEQTQPKMKRIKGDLSQVIVKMGFHTVPVTHADYPALSCLSILLGKGRSSRFYKTLKEDKQFVHGVGCSQIAFQDIGYFVIESEVKQDFVPQTEEEIFSEIGRLAREPAHALEMKRIHSIIESSFFRDKEDVMGQAMSLAYHESMGDYQRVLKQIDAIRSQTALDLNRVAEKYFRFENMSLLEYVPHELGDGAEVENRLDSLKKRVEKKHEILKEPIESLPRKPVSPLSWDFTTMKPGSKSREVISLEAGVTLLYQHVPGVPLVSIHAYFPGGRKDENEKNCGITQFLLKTSLKGTENRTADEVFFDLESLGTSVHPESNADHFGYATSLLSEDFEKGIEILSDILFNPIFPETEIEKERSVVLSLINRIKDDMFYHPIELFYRALYGSHPYGLPRNGTPESVKSFTRSQLLDWYAQIFSFRHLVVSVVGDIPKERVIREIQNGFSLQPDTSPISLAEV
ncbi:MAG: insulinase family protein, partial [Bdellovibrionales bacterium]|nr:insulinase family protein [Bdellovibrionales bacterium]